jgi:hypothetical protein
VLLPSRETKNDVESASLEASTMFSTGTFAPPVPKSGFETKTRNLMPLGLCVVVLEEPLPPQEIMPTLAVKSTKMLTKILFKPGTPKGMKNRDLDARKRIITERLRRNSVGGPKYLPPRCKSNSPLVF